MSAPQAMQMMDRPLAAPTTADSGAPPAVARRMPTTATVQGNYIGIVHDAALSTNTRFLYACCSCNSCCWFKLKKRTHVQVHENRIESNYPCYPICCLGLCCLTDCVTTKYFDQIGSTIITANGCTCYHCCGIWPCCGGVVSHAPTECQNSDGCRCTGCACSTTYPGLLNAPLFAAYANEARSAFNRGQRLIPAPLRQTMTGGKEANGAHMHPINGVPQLAAVNEGQPVYGGGIQLVHVGGVHQPNTNNGTGKDGQQSQQPRVMNAIPFHPTYGLPIAMPVHGAPAVVISSVPPLAQQHTYVTGGIGATVVTDMTIAMPPMMDSKSRDEAFPPLPGATDAASSSTFVSSSSSPVIGPPSYLIATHLEGSPASPSSSSSSGAGRSSRGSVVDSRTSTMSNSTIDVPHYIGDRDDHHLLDGSNNTTASSSSSSHAAAMQLAAANAAGSPVTGTTSSSTSSEFVSVTKF